MEDFDSIARAQVAALLAGSDPDNPVTVQQVAEAIQRYAREQLAELPPSNDEVEKQGIQLDEAHVDEALEKGIDLIVEMVDGNPHQRIKFSEENIQKHFGGEDPWARPPGNNNPPPNHKGFDIINAISVHPVITAHLGLFLRPRDLIKLYSTSRDFHDAIDRHLLSSIILWLRTRAPNAVSDFPFKLYGPSTIKDPAGRTFAYGMRHPIPNQPWVHTPRIIPSLRWYHMVADRERYVQQIIAFMARSGHRFPESMATALKRIWLIMDVASNRGRVGFMKNKRFWTDVDLYNTQMFWVKLGLLFNDPIRGPASDSMTKLMLGQRGLFPLWQLLYRKKFTTIPELVELKVRYEYTLRQEHVRLAAAGVTVFNIPFREVGRGHLEGWGLGSTHLYRPDELAMAEATRRQLDLDDHLENMALWGLVDWQACRGTIPSEEEMYLSDEDEMLERVDTSGMYKMRHPKKARWDTLTETEKEEIRVEERLEEMQAVKVARCTGFPAEDGTVQRYPVGQLPVLRMTDRENYELNWETRRGWMAQHATKGEKDEALAEMPLYERQPTDAEQRDLEAVVKDGLSRAEDMISEDDKLKAQAWYNYEEEDLDFDYEGYAADLENGVVWEAEDEESGDEGGGVEGGIGAEGEAHIVQLMELFGVGDGGEGGAGEGEGEDEDEDEDEDWNEDEDVEMLDV